MSLRINIKCGVRENQQARIRNQYRDCAAGTGQKYRSSISEKRKIVSPAEALDQV
jgi:hypothetical protein